MPIVEQSNNPDDWESVQNSKKLMAKLRAEEPQVLPDKPTMNSTTSSTTSTSSISDVTNSFLGGSSSTTGGAVDSLDIASITNTAKSTFGDIFKSDTSTNSAVQLKLPAKDVLESMMTKGMPQATTFVTSTLKSELKDIEIGNTLKGLSTDLLNSVDISELSAVASRLASELPDTDEAFSSLKQAAAESTFLQSVGGVFSDIGEAVWDGVSAVGDGITAVTDAVSDVGGELLDSIGTTLSGLDSFIESQTGLSTLEIASIATSTYATYLSYSRPYLQTYPGYASSTPMYYNASIPYVANANGSPIQDLPPYVNNNILSALASVATALNLPGSITPQYTQFHYQQNLYNHGLGLAIDNNIPYSAQYMISQPRYDYTSQSMVRSRTAANFPHYTLKMINIVLNAIGPWWVPNRYGLARNVMARNPKDQDELNIALGILSVLNVVSKSQVAHSKTTNNTTIQWNNPPTNNQIIWNSPRITSSNTEILKSTGVPDSVIAQSNRTQVITL